jgi:hypothetical protein
VKTWLTAVPKIDDYEEVLPADDIEKRVNDWLRGGTSEPDVKTESVGTLRSGKTTDDDDDLKSFKKTNGSSTKKSMDDLEDAFADLE